MKTLFIFLGIIILLLSGINKSYIPVADYYVSTTLGDDSNDGSLAHPFKTLTKVSSLTLTGKTIALFSNDVFDGSLIIQDTYNTNDSTIVTYYGRRDKRPTITGLKSITGWTNLSGNIWYIQSNDFPSEIRNVFKGDSCLELGRYPASGFNNTSSNIGTNTLGDTLLTQSNNYFQHGEIVYKPNVFTMCKSRIDSLKSKVFYFSNMTSSSNLGYGYFIQNHHLCLNANLQWAYEANTKTLYIYANQHPTNIKVSYYDNPVVLNNCNKTRISDIKIKGGNANNILLHDSYNVLIKNCELTYAGVNDINCYQNHDIRVTNCTSNYSNNSFINFERYRIWPVAIPYYRSVSYNIEVDNNRITNCALELGKSQFFNLGCSNAMTFESTYNVTVHHNYLSNIGYIGIKWSSCGDADIYNNYVTKWCKTLTDGGAIYTWSNNLAWNNTVGNTKYGGNVHDNLIENGEAETNLVGVPASTYSTHVGIYNDDGSHKINVYNNTVLGCYFACKNGTNVDTINIKNNTFIVDKNTSLGNIYIGNGSHRVVIKDNLMIAEYNDNLYNCQYYGVGYLYDDTIKNNSYFLPFGQMVANKPFEYGGATYTYTEWIAADLSSWRCYLENETNLTASLWLNSDKPKQDYVYHLLNPSNNSRIVFSTELPYNDYIYLNGNAVTFPVIIEPYQSLILVRPE